MDVLSYKCPCCSAGLGFSSDRQKMHCDSCGNDFDIEILRQFDEAVNASKEGETLEWEQYHAGSGRGDWEQDEAERMSMYSCPSCGAQIVADENTAATHCVYCGNPTLLASRLSGMFKPDYVIPFKVGKQAAEAALKKFCKRKPLLPKFFLEDSHIEDISGVYVPFWLFDCDTHAGISYNATRVTSWRQGNYQYTKTSHYLIDREGDICFDGVPVDGSSKMDDAYMEAIEPFDYREAVDFQTAYLSGYLADKYDVDAEQSKPRANNRITASTEAKFRQTVVGYSSVTPRSKNISIKSGRIRYTLLPVWMLNTRYKDKVYTFAMNGQTGRFVGELPVSRGRYWAWLGGLFGALTLLGYAVLLIAALAA